MARKDYYSELSKKDEFYCDFHHSFLAHPGNGQIIKRTNEDAIKMSIRNLILTNRYERLGNPDIGSDIRATLFELADFGISDVLQAKIENTLENYEPRCEVEDVIVKTNEDSNKVEVSIIFSTRNIPEPIKLDLTLVRDR
jgi:phage baseplate assembly protein W